MSTLLPPAPPGLDATTGPVGPARWRLAPRQAALLVLALAGLVAACWPGLRFMVATWEQVDEFSYGWFIPPVCAWLLWQRRATWQGQPFAPAWGGLGLVALGLLLNLAGAASAVRVVSQHGFVLALLGLAWALCGTPVMRRIGVSIALLATMVPLPQFLLRELSQQLQLLSSKLGVAIIRAFDISVYLEGNVIDLGSMKLQVVEACSGLRYLFPLMVLGVIAAYAWRGPMWKRLLLVGSTVPMTLLVNSLRIGVIGVTVEYWGHEMAEGLLHDFEGFFMFMLCIGLLLLEMRLLARLGRRQGRDEGLQFDEPAMATPGSGAGAGLPQDPVQPASRPLLAATVLIVASALALWYVPAPVQQTPERPAFSSFPLQLAGGWQGRRDSLTPDIRAWLAFDDYLLTDYTRAGSPPVNLYSAWYASQGSGESTHSPRTCLPGDGWAILEMAAVSLPTAAGPLPVNRVLITKGEHRQLVYYWFEQRGRHLTGELAVKWYILRDGLVRHRSDGALVRLVTPMPPGEPAAEADARLTRLLDTVRPLLARHIPN